MIIGDRYFLDDAETGLYEVSKQEYYEYRKFMASMFERIKPKFKSEDITVGKIIITGTAGDFDDRNQYFFNIFYNPENNQR